MSTSRHSLFEAVLARISLGAVPMDGIYWFDPKAIIPADTSKRTKARDEPADPDWSPVSQPLGKSS
jgi:hypothetical protein